MVGRALALSLLILFAIPLHAQEPPAPPDTTAVDSAAVPDTLGQGVTQDTVETPRDTVRYQPSDELLRYIAPTDTVNLEAHLSQNPTLALFKSMVVPGWGQAGNGDYLKAIIFLGLDAWMVGAAIHYGRQASDFKKEFNAAVTADDRNAWYALYDDRRSERNKFTWFAVIVSFVSMFDAYVDAHFSGFPDADREPRLGFDIGPGNGGGVAASITVPF